MLVDQFVIMIEFFFLSPQNSTPSTKKMAAWKCSGPMRAGKTTELLRIYDRLGGRKLLVTHSLHRIETRTHGGQHYALEHRVAELLPFVCEHVETTDSLCIDEAQFFEVDDLRAALVYARERGRAVYVAGLDCDYQKNVFSWMSAIEWTQQVKLAGRCQRCTSGAPAIYTAYEGPPLGGTFAPDSEDFVTCCDACWTLPTTK